ncbi:hypothetical protein LXL04_018617 [Taraxacum kok-saghyz]
MEVFKLCDDMLKTKVLSRASLKTLDAIRCTGKEFEKFTYEPYLLHLNKQRNNMVSGFIMEDINRYYEYTHEFTPSRGSSTIDLTFLPRKAKILASCEQGLIVFENPHPTTYGLVSYHICKPATKQVVAIPNPKTKYLIVNMAIVTLGSNPLHYKIVRLSRSSSWSVLKRSGEFYGTYRCEVFDSITWAWKKLDLLMVPFCVHLTNSQPITTRGSIYMLLTDTNILKFDAYLEKWSTFSSPIDYGDFTRRELVKHDGRLGLTCKPEGGCREIWVLGSDELWEKIYVINGEDDVEYARTMSFDDPNTSLMIYSNVILFYKRE